MDSAWKVTFVSTLRGRLTRTHLERENLDGVEGLEGCDGRLSGGAVVVMAVGKYSSGGCDGDPDAGASDHARQHEWSSANLIDEASTG